MSEAGQTNISELPKILDSYEKLYQLLEKQLEENKADRMIIQKQAEEFQRLQNDYLSLWGDRKQWRSIAGRITSAGAVVGIAPREGNFINLVKVIVSGTVTAGATIEFNVIDRGGTARPFFELALAANSYRVLEFGGLLLDRVKYGNTYMTSADYDVEVGDGVTERFRLDGTGTMTEIYAWVIWYETQGVSY